MGLGCSSNVHTIKSEGEVYNEINLKIYFTDLVVIGCLPELYDLLVPGLP